jgi:hypothetical protein
LMFGQYLDQDGPGFVDDCTRLAKKKKYIWTMFFIDWAKQIPPPPPTSFF